MARTIAPAQTIEEFLKQRGKSSLTAREAKKKWEERKERYLFEVNKLFDKFIPWLDKLKESGPISYERKPAPIFGDDIGGYAANELDVYVADRKVIFRPVGTKIYGGMGRIDVLGNGEFQLI
ncbi:MAG TPA: hypothetical protein VGM92_13865, partial [Candidatus Kapabacteria bacterium]